MGVPMAPMPAKPMMSVEGFINLSIKSNIYKESVKGLATEDTEITEKNV
jgi:hypothetical protein